MHTVSENQCGKYALLLQQARTEAQADAATRFSSHLDAMIRHITNPVKRGEQVIEQVTLMKPNAGTLRGVSLAAVANSEVDALIKVLPRMTAPMLTEQEVAALELPDLVALAGKVVGFLSPNSVQ